MILFHFLAIPNGYQNESGGTIFRFYLITGISRHFHGNLRIFSIAYPFHFHLKVLPEADPLQMILLTQALLIFPDRHRNRFVIW